MVLAQSQSATQQTQHPANTSPSHPDRPRDTGKDAPVIDIHTRRGESSFARPVSIPAAPPKKVHPYYQYGPILSYNAYWNLIIGGRGLGKTYGYKELAIKRYLRTTTGPNTGEQFIYLRRYKEELTVVRETFFADIQHMFPDWDFRAMGNVFQISPASQRDTKGREWETIGYLMALSTAQKQKSVSFHRVTTVCYDEFIIEKGAVHYITNEAEVLTNFYSTVDRWQDKTKMFLLANAVSIGNPYFGAWNIYPDPDREFIRRDIAGRKNYLVATFPKAEEFAASVMQTHFGQFIKGTSYADYAVGNLFSDNGMDLVTDKDPDAKYKFTLDTRHGAFTIWHNIRSGRYYATSNEVGNETRYTTVAARVSENVRLLYFQDMPIQLLRTAHRRGRVLFNSPATRNAFAEFLEKK